MNRRKKNRYERRGAVLVEFAICASMFFVFVFAVLEFGRFFYVQHSIQMAAYEATRAGIVPGADVADVELRAESLLNISGIPSAAVSVTPTAITTLTREVTVRIDCNFEQNSWLSPMFLTNRDVSAEVTLQHENNAYLGPEDLELANLIGNNDSEPIDD